MTRADLVRGRAVDHFASKCISSLPTSIRLECLPGNVAPCVLLSIGALEAGSRSWFERRIEVAMARMSSRLVRLRAANAVSDPSVGPFQLRATTAARVTTVSLDTLVRWESAAHITGELLMSRLERAIGCEDVLLAWSVHKGGRLTAMEGDVGRLVHLLVHGMLEEMEELTDLARETMASLLSGARASRQNLFALRRVDGNCRYDFPTFTADGVVPMDSILELEASGYLELQAVDATSYRARITERGLALSHGRPIEVYSL